mmetsp:Transcript_85641/g.277391  ORF Transcript_85641/g.277391 Transcript_85641/m.277391 type:complete len:232 (+) Transcript_85641:186-881(+)
MQVQHQKAAPSSQQAESLREPSWGSKRARTRSSRPVWPPGATGRRARSTPWRPGPGRKRAGADASLTVGGVPAEHQDPSATSMSVHVATACTPRLVSRSFSLASGNFRGLRGRGKWSPTLHNVSGSLTTSCSTCQRPQANRSRNGVASSSSALPGSGCSRLMALTSTPPQTAAVIGCRRRQSSGQASSAPRTQKLRGTRAPPSARLHLRASTCAQCCQSWASHGWPSQLRE